MRARISIWVYLMIVCCVATSGCGTKAPTLSQEIDFSQEAYPDFVVAVTGLSDREDWGRWSDANVAPSVKIKFKNPLPKNFNLTITAQVTDRNESPVVHIGSFDEELFIQKVGETVTIPVELKETTDTIEIVPPNPVSPKELGLNADRRKLGVGLYSVKISG